MKTPFFQDQKLILSETPYAIEGSITRDVESIRNNIDFDSECKINTFAIKGENFVTVREA